MEDITGALCDPKDASQDVNEHMNVHIAEKYKYYLLSGGKNYTANNYAQWKERAQIFVVQEGTVAL